MHRRAWLLGLVLLTLTIGVAPAEASDAGQNRPGNAIERPLQPPSRSAGTWVAKILLPSAAYRRPGGAALATRLRTWTPWSRSAQYLMVLRSAMHKGRQWLLLRFANRPNVARGWVPRDRVMLLHSPNFVEISVSRRRVQLFEAGRRIASYPAVVGHPRTPTPLGLFAILERVKQPEPRGFLGPWAVHLTSHSEVLRKFDGGPGRIAIHGRGGDSFKDPLGSARSNGCIRISNKAIRRLARLRPGTAVKVVR